MQSVATLVACVGSSCGPQALGAWVSVVVTQGLISCVMSMGFAREGVAKEYIFLGVWIFEKGRFI